MIPAHNIYYMLSYAFQVLNKQGYKDISLEEFENATELCAAILQKGIAIEIKRGLYKAYISQTETISGLRGRIDITDSLKAQSLVRKQLVCTYDEFSSNVYFNQIIKSTVHLLVRSDLPKARKTELRKLIIFFADVDLIDVRNIDWDTYYNRNNQSYRMLISICNLIIKGLLQTQENGTARLMDFIDEKRMHNLYEKFILEYYRKEFPQITVNASQIAWQLDDDNNSMLPIMQTDIMLTKGHRVLIIDAKYYSRTTQLQYGKNSLHSGNLYQIYTYVKNKESELKGTPHEVSGMLLYAKTDESILPNNIYHMGGNKISVQTLDLDQDFDGIASQLDSIVEDHFCLGVE